MGEYTETAYVGADSEHVFGKQLFELTRKLHLPLPYFRGRVLDSNVPGVERWEVRTIMLADPTNSQFETLDFSKTYPSWKEGVNSAMLYLLSRMCYAYYDDLPVDSQFRMFGRRDDDGTPMVTVGDRSNISLLKKHMEDMEFYAEELEYRRHMEMTVGDQAKAVLHAQSQEIDMLHSLKGHMEQDIHSLQVENLEKDNQIAALQAQLAQLQPPPPPPAEDDDDDDESDDDDDDESDDDGDDDEDDDDDAGDGAAEAEEEPEVEEDPEEVIHHISSDEEDTPAMNTRGRKRKCSDSRAYFKRFKM